MQVLEIESRLLQESEKEARMQEQLAGLVAARDAMNSKRQLVQELGDTTVCDVRVLLTLVAP